MVLVENTLSALKKRYQKLKI